MTSSWFLSSWSYYQMRNGGEHFAKVNETLGSCFAIGQPTILMEGTH